MREPVAKTNYSFEKRKRELDQKKKKAEKAVKKLAAQRSDEAPEALDQPLDPETEPTPDQP